MKIKNTQPLVCILLLILSTPLAAMNDDKARKTKIAAAATAITAAGSAPQGSSTLTPAARPIDTTAGTFPQGLRMGKDGRLVADVAYYDESL